MILLLNLGNMRDFNIYDWKEVCENIHNINHNKNPELFKQIMEIYPYPIHEGFNIKRFKNYCGSVAIEIHFTIANIWCLGNNVCKDCVNHWRTELLGYFNKIITAHVDGNVKRDKIVYSEIIEPYLNTKEYTYDTDMLFIQAMKDELRKGENNNTPAQKVISSYIKNEIIPNITNIIEKYNTNIQQLFNDLLIACKTGDINMFKEKLDIFINSVTQ